MMPYTYSLILFFTVIICFVASFDKRLRFDREFVPFLKSAALVAVFLSLGMSGLPVGECGGLTQGTP